MRTISSGSLPEDLRGTPLPPEYPAEAGREPLASPPLGRFTPISLESLNARARLMHRRDSKYVLTESQLHAFLDYARRDFNALDIGGLRQFRYRSIYFDFTDLRCYHDHNKGRRRRLKIRQRHYVDSDLYFMELKLKGLRDITHKYRIPIASGTFGARTLPAPLLAFFRNAVQSHYGRGWEQEPVLSLIMDYYRSTLVAKEGSERITLDHGLAFRDEHGAARLPANRWIVEIKSRTGTSDADRWLTRHHIHPAPSCSKYGLAVSLLKLPHKNNRFRPVIRRRFQT